MESGSGRVALALGSGGARGYAHIGAIEVLRDRGYEIVSVAGSSMGAVVGGMFAAGKIDAFTEWATGLGRGDVLRMFDPSITGPGVIGAEKIVTRLRNLLAGAVIEELPVPFTAVATDLLARKAVWFQEGPVDVAIRASIAIPGLITPILWNGRLLADGGIIDPLPIMAAASSRADTTVAVSLTGERLGHSEGPVRESAFGRPVDEWIDRFRHTAEPLLDKDAIRTFTDRVRDRTDIPRHASRHEHADSSVDPRPLGLGLREVMNLSLEAMQDLVTRYRLAGYPPDILVNVPKDACRTMEFHRASEMIELGRHLTAEALDAGSSMSLRRAREDEAGS